MHLIVGLGNPGKEFEHTRHNAGFDTVSLLAEKHNIRLNKSRCKALTGEGVIAGQKVLLALPQTYMNLSGEAVSPLMSFYKLPLTNLLVVYDDIDLPKGRLRVRPGGSAGTHNGMRSIIYRLGQDAFARVRVGIGKPDNPQMDLKDFVVGHYPREDWKEMFDCFLRAGEAVEEILANGVEKAMSRFNGA